MRFNFLSTVIATLLFLPLPTYGQYTEETLAEIKREVEALETEFSELGGDSGSVESNIEIAEKQIEELEQGFAGKEESLEEKEYLLAVYKSSFRVVSELKRGDPLGTLKMPDGSVLEQVVYLDASSRGVQLQTTSGLITLKASDLPASLVAKIKLPSEIPEPSTNLAAIRSTKPGAVVAVDQPGAESSKIDAGKAEQSAESTVHERNELRKEKIKELNNALREAGEQVAKLRTEKRNLQREFSNAKIKKSKSYQEEAIGGIDNHIQAANARIERIKAELRQVYSEFE